MVQVNGKVFRIGHGEENYALPSVDKVGGPLSTKVSLVFSITVLFIAVEKVQWFRNPVLNIYNMLQ